jgi:hypothetical protein
LSTCEPTLARRLAGHVGKYQQYLKGKYHFVTSYEIIKNGNYDIILIENVKCDSKDQLTARERYYIESLDCINKLIPGRTDKQYREDNKEKIQQKNSGKDSYGRPGDNSQSPAQDALLVLPFYSLLGRESSFLFLLWDSMEKVEMKRGSGRGQDLSLSPPLDFKKSLRIFLLLLNEFLPFHFLPNIRQEGGRLRPQSFFHSRLKSLPHFSVALGFEFFVSLPPKLLSRLEFVE